MNRANITGNKDRSLLFQSWRRGEHFGDVVAGWNHAKVADRRKGTGGEQFDPLERQRSARKVTAGWLETGGGQSSPCGRQCAGLSGVQQLVLKRWGMSQRLGALRGHVDVLEDATHGGVIGDEGDDLHL